VGKRGKRKARFKGSEVQRIKGSRGDSELVGEQASRYIYLQTRKHADEPTFFLSVAKKTGFKGPRVQVRD
jgi:hypothetical protein